MIGQEKVLQLSLLRFLELKDKVSLQNQDHFRYLQSRDLCVRNERPKDKSRTGKMIIDIFLKVNDHQESLSRIISKLCSAVQILKSDHLLKMKARWEGEGNLTVTQEE